MVLNVFQFHCIFTGNTQADTVLSDECDTHIRVCSALDGIVGNTIAALTLFTTDMNVVICVVNVIYSEGRAFIDPPLVGYHVRLVAFHAHNVCPSQSQGRGGIRFYGNSHHSGCCTGVQLDPVFVVAFVVVIKIAQMTCYCFADSNLLCHLFHLFVRLCIVGEVVGGEQVFQGIAAMTLLAVQVQIVCSSTSVFDGQRIVHHPPLAGTRRISLVLLLQIADFHPPEFQVVVLLTSCDELYTTVLWHNDLVAVVVVTIIIGIEVTNASLYCLPSGNLIAFTNIVIRFGIIGSRTRGEVIFQRTGTCSAFSTHMQIVRTFTDISDF